MKPSVTVLIPARNEEADIAGCVEHVLAQDHPHDRLEIVMVDGGSTDGTRRVAEGLLAGADVSWTIVDNPTGTTPSNLNAGLAAATGDILCRIDARSRVPSGYVAACAELLSTRPEVAVTGGAQVAVARTSSPVEVGIARALNNRYAMGGSRYRSGAGSGPADTVYLGAFRTRELRAAGGWDEAMLSNQDYELNRRMGRRGLVWVQAELGVGYLPRRRISELWSQYVRFGRWKVRYWRHTGDRPQVRQLVPLVGLPLTTIGASAVLLRRPRASTALGLGLGGVGALVALDEIGSSSNASPLVRVVSASALAAVLLGWPVGVALECVTKKAR